MAAGGIIGAAASTISRGASGQRYGTPASPQKPRRQDLGGVRDDGTLVGRGGRTQQLGEAAKRRLGSSTATSADVGKPAETGTAGQDVSTEGSAPSVPKAEPAWKQNLDRGIGGQGSAAANKAALRGFQLQTKPMEVPLAHGNPVNDFMDRLPPAVQQRVGQLAAERGLGGPGGPVGASVASTDTPDLQEMIRAAAANPRDTGFSPEALQVGTAGGNGTDLGVARELPAGTRYGSSGQPFQPGGPIRMAAGPTMAPGGPTDMRKPLRGFQVPGETPPIAAPTPGVPSMAKPNFATPAGGTAAPPTTTPAVNYGATAPRPTARGVRNAMASF